jgi:hypothetical protein
MIMVVIIIIWYLFGIFKLSFAMLNPQGCPASYLLQKKNVLVSIFFPSQSLIVAAFVSFLSHFFITSIYWLTCSHTKYAWTICSWSFSQSTIYQIISSYIPNSKPGPVICPDTLIRRIPDNTLNNIFLSNMWVHMILNI